MEGFHLDGDGGITEVNLPDSLDAGSAGMMLSISNDIDGVVRTDLADNVIADPTVRATHVDNIAALASDQVVGIEIAYAGVDPDLADSFSSLWPIWPPSCTPRTRSWPCGWTRL
jgi:hypothetical protein